MWREVMIVVTGTFSLTLDTAQQLEPCDDCFAECCLPTMIGEKDAAFS